MMPVNVGVIKGNDGMIQFIRKGMPPYYFVQDKSAGRTLGELVAEIYRTAWEYNHMRIHSALKMPPSVFAEKMAA
jgi:hypothetical protein